MIILLSQRSQAEHFTADVMKNTLHREPVEGCVRPLSGPGGLVLLLLLREPLGLHLARQVSEECVPAPVVVRLGQGSLTLQAPRQHPAVLLLSLLLLLLLLLLSLLLSLSSLLLII